MNLKSRNKFHGRGYDHDNHQITCWLRFLIQFMVLGLPKPSLWGYWEPREPQEPQEPWEPREPQEPQDHELYKGRPPLVMLMFVLISKFLFFYNSWGVKRAPCQISYVLDENQQRNSFPKLTTFWLFLHECPQLPQSAQVCHWKYPQCYMHLWCRLPSLI